MATDTTDGTYELTLFDALTSHELLALETKLRSAIRKFDYVADITEDTLINVCDDISDEMVHLFCLVTDTHFVKSRKSA